VRAKSNASVFQATPCAFDQQQVGTLLFQALVIVRPLGVDQAS
jgi:hypothetical protein